MKALDLFSGIGGFSLALRRTGLARTVAYCEIDPFARAVLAARIADGELDEGPIHEDICKLDGTQFRGAVDLVVGGFPCQDISAAGKGAGLDGARSGLWWEMWRIVEQTRPAWVLAENVPALRSRGADDVIASLEELGYEVWPLVVGAWAVGAPHKRDRAWIVARLADGEGGRRATEGQRREPEAGGRPDVRDQAMVDAEGQPEREPEHEASTGSREVARQDAGGGCPRGLADADGGAGVPARRADGVSDEGQAVARGDGAVADSDREGLRCGGESEHGELQGAPGCVADGCGPGGRGRGAAVADAACCGVEGLRAAGLEEPAVPAGEGLPRCDCGGDRWPARPGEPQHDWEAPRLVEFALGGATSRLPGALVSLGGLIHGATGDSGSGTTVRGVWHPYAEEALRRTPRRSGRIPPQTILQSAMRGGGTPDESSDARHAPVADKVRDRDRQTLRELRERVPVEPSSRQWQQGGQLTLECPDPVCRLPYAVALDEREAAAISRTARFVNRNSLKAYGNSIVPQVAEAVFRAIAEVIRKESR